MQDSNTLLRKAEELSQEFRNCSSEIEKARRLSPEISQKIAAAGFYRLGAPAYIGGLEAPPAVSSQIFETLAQGDAACAWVAFIGTTTSTMLSMLPKESATHIFSHPDQLVTGVAAPTGVAEKVEGGFRVSGRWQWGSGSQNAEWVSGGCLLKENGELMLDAKGNPRNHGFFMPKDDVEFLDTWHVSGLRGTGSLDYTATDVFVPEERVTGYKKHDETLGSLYAFPHFTFLALGIGAVCMGIARAAIDELVTLAATKKRISSRKTVADQQISQMKLAQAEADLRSARLFYYHELENGWQSALAGNRVSVEQRRNIRLATTNAVNKSVAVVNEMYDLGGGSSVYENSSLQRHFRDINVAKSHIMVAPSTMETAGRLFFELNANTATL